MKEKIELQIINLDHQGRGIGKIDNKIIFIPNALIDEVVLVEITADHKNFYEGEVLEYIKKSPLRVEPGCPYYIECGGCNLMHMGYTDQLAYKENKVKEILTRFGGIDESLVQPIIGNEEAHYRNKITLQVIEKVGYFKRRSYDVIEIDSCLISDSRNEALIKEFKDLPLENINQIILRSSINTTDQMIVLDTTGPINEEAYINHFKDMNIVKKERNNYTTLSGQNYIVEKLGEYSFIISADSFFQINTLGAIKLYDLIVKYANLSGIEKVLDLYCGTGSIGLYMANNAKEVLGVESNQYAVLDANKNKELNKITNIGFKCGDVGTILNTLEYKPDVIVVDPPRLGLNKFAVDHLLKVKAPKFIYVSCDPATLARDLKLLTELYKVEEITPVDMFPNTYHVECVVLMTLK